MNFYIVDDSLAIRSMLAEIIEKEALGTVVGSASDGLSVTNEDLDNLQVDILVIDLLMPERDGIETIRYIMPAFKGRVIMISQVDNKDLIAEAYSLGIDHYITKPINKYEVIGVVKKVTEHLTQHQSLQNIQESLHSLLAGSKPVAKEAEPTLGNENTIVSATSDILVDLGLVGEGGYNDLINIVEYLAKKETDCRSRFSFPSLKELFYSVAEKHCQNYNDPACIKKEAKASEQRVRRAIHQTLENLASIGLTDYGNATFEHFSSKLFDFTVVRNKMLELEGKVTKGAQSRINIKKFIETLYLESKENSH